VEEVIDMVGLREVARKRAGGFSLGMGQRLGIASALLGDPATVILDEPVNGLDPEGVLWIRNLLKDLAAQGRTVFVSSHLMSEMALTAERLIVVGRGRLIADTTVEEFIAGASANNLRVRASDTTRLRDLLVDADVSSADDGTLSVSGTTPERIGDTAAAHGIAIYELSAQTASLEEAFMEVTRDAVEYRPTTEAARHTLGAQR
jgi:ABC-2 type transport system ATP-binding protein